MAEYKIKKIDREIDREGERKGESLLHANTFIIHYAVYVKLFVYPSSCLISSCLARHHKCFDDH